MTIFQFALFAIVVIGLGYIAGRTKSLSGFVMFLVAMIIIGVATAIILIGGMR